MSIRSRLSVALSARTAIALMASRRSSSARTLSARHPAHLDKKPTTRPSPPSHRCSGTNRKLTSCQQCRNPFSEAREMAVHAPTADAEAGSFGRSPFVDALTVSGVPGAPEETRSPQWIQLRPQQLRQMTQRAATSHCSQPARNHHQHRRSQYETKWRLKNESFLCCAGHPRQLSYSMLLSAQTSRSLNAVILARLGTRF